MQSDSLRLQLRDAFATVHPDCKPARARPATSLTLAAMSLGFAVVQLDITIHNTALSAIGISIGGGVSQLQWVVNAYTITFAAFILTAGALGDRIGAKRVFAAGFSIFAVTSLACAFAQCLGLDRGARHPRAWGGNPGAEFAGAASARLCRRDRARPRGRNLGRRR